MKTNSRCEAACQHLIAELEINPRPKDIFMELLEIYPGCKEALTDIFETWTDLDSLEVPEPSAQMHASFYRALNEFESPLAGTKQAKTRPLASNILRYAAVGLILMFAGVFISRQAANDEPSYVYEARENPPLEATNVAWKTSTTQRLEIIENARQQNQPDAEVLAAVNSALCHDESVNVRISAIEALLHFSDDPQVRSYLIEAIPLQESPIVQIALADAITAIQDKAAIEPLNKMLESGNLGLEVADYYEDAIKILM